MQLPHDSVGVSDIKDWVECPRRMSYQMKRHTLGKDPPEAELNPNVRYGSAIHDAIEYVEKQGASDDEAVQFLIAHGHRWLEPDDIAEIKEDLTVYRTREPLGVRTVMAETEIRVPLLIHKGTQIFYRGRIDRLYQSLEDPTRYFHRDYKSSRWRKTQEEVDRDVQMSAYNWALYEWMPELEFGTLSQTYDQLKFGELHTSRSPKDRREIQDWLRMQVVAILEDEDYGPDGLLVPSFNDWCAYCPIMESCAVVRDLSDYAVAQIALLAPEQKKGRKTEIALDPALFDVYLAELPKAMKAKGVLDRYEKAVRAALLKLPTSERERLGFDTRSKRIDVFSAEAMRAAHGLLGDDFYEIASMPKTALQSALRGDPDRLKLVLGMADQVSGAPYVQAKRGSA